jgi:hypothetical protein
MGRTATNAIEFICKIGVNRLLLEHVISGLQLIRQRFRSDGRWVRYLQPSSKQLVQMLLLPLTDEMGPRLSALGCGRLFLRQRYRLNLNVVS